MNAKPNSSYREASGGGRIPLGPQRGVVLFVALIVLVALSLAGLAVVRTVDTGALISGNLAFRRNAVHSADLGVEQARTWILAKAATGEHALDDNIAPSYFASWSISGVAAADAGNPNKWNWTNTGSTIAIPPGSTDNMDSTGNEVRYVIHRLCDATGIVKDHVCVKATTTGGQSKQSRGYSVGAAPTVAATPYFRITTRVSGPRGTVAYVQSIVY